MIEILSAFSLVLAVCVISSDASEIIEYDGSGKVALIYYPERYLYRTYDWDSEPGKVEVLEYMGEYVPGGGINPDERVSVSLYETNGDTDPLDGTLSWRRESLKEIFYNTDGSIFRERFDGREEYLPGEEVPVKVINGIYGSAERIEPGESGEPALTIHYYEDWPLSGDPWGSFNLGKAGEYVYVMREMTGTHLERIFVYISGEVCNPMTGVEWTNSKMINNAEYFLGLLQEDEEAGALHDFLLDIDLGVLGIMTRDELVSYLKGKADENHYIEDDVDDLVERIYADNPDIANSSIETGVVYEIDPAKFSMYRISPHFPVCEYARDRSGFPYTFYSSGRVRTRSGMPREETHFTRGEESTGKIYIYADEDYYPEETVEGFLKTLIYYADGTLGEASLKKFLTEIELEEVEISDTAGMRAYLDDNASPENGYSQEDVKYLFESIPSDWPYMGSGRLVEEVFPDGRRKVYIYDEDTDVITETKIYDFAGNLIEKKTRITGDENFIRLGSLPWIRYGEGLGTRSWDGWHSGYSRERGGDEGLTGEEELRANLLKWSGGTVRIFLFGDLRCGLKFEAGEFTGFTDHVLDDMETLLDVAEELDIQLIPVIFDYRMADDESGDYEREYPELITDESKTAVLLDHFGWFFNEISKMSNYGRILAWDVMNEPELCGEGYNGDKTGVTMEDVQRFVRKFVQKIHETDSSAKVTVGSLTKEFMAKYWMLPDMAMEDGDLSALDIYQFHYYDSSSQWHDNDMENLSYHKTLLQGYAFANDPFRYFYAPGRFSGRPVFGGEIDPTFVEGKIDTLYNYGYNGLLFWDDKGNMLGPEEYDAVRNWFPGARYTYYSDTGRLESETVPAEGASSYVYRYYSDEPYQYVGTPDERGCVLAEVMAGPDEFGAMGYTYEYQGNGSVKVTAYHSANITRGTMPVFSGQVYSEDLDALGSPVEGTRVFSAVYYPDSWYKMADLTEEGTKYYLNENWESRGYGRESIEDRSDGVYVYSIISGQYQRFGEWVWETADFSDPMAPKFEGFRGYTGDWNGSTTEYYNNEAPVSEKKMKSRYLPGGDAYGIEFYLYLNEEIESVPNTSGVPRVALARLCEANAKGEWTYVYEYHEGSQNISRISSYSVPGSVPSGMEDLDRVAVYDYDPLGRISEVSLKDPNIKSEKAFEYEYYEGAGKLKRVTSYSDEDKTKELFVYYYDENGNNAGFSSFSEEGGWAVKKSYDDKDRLVREENTDISFWKRENIGGEDIGFFSFDSAKGTYVDCGNDNTMNTGNNFTLYAMARIDKDGGGYLISKADGDQSQYGMAISPDTGSLFFVYGDAANRKQLDLNFYSEDWRDGEWHEFVITVKEANPPNSVWLTGYVDGKAYRQRNTYYSEINWRRRDSDRDHGIYEKPDVPVLLGARGDGDGGTAFILDGDMASAGIYDRTLSSLEIKNMSEGTDITEGLVSLWDFSAEGSRDIADATGENNGHIYASFTGTAGFQTISYTYYGSPDSNRTESKTFECPDEKGNVYYHYVNTELNLTDVSQLAEANEDGEIAFEYEYYEGTDKVQYKRSYLDAERQDLYGIYEYGPDGTLIGFTPGSGPAAINCVEKTFSTGVCEIADHVTALFGKVATLMSEVAGENIIIAVLDSGLDISRLTVNLVGGYDFAGEDRKDAIGSSDFDDILGHGTGTTEVISGIASESDVLAVKVLDGEGKTNADILSKAIVYSVEMGARVLAMPLTLHAVTDQLKEAISYAVNKGAMLFAAAGNEGAEIKDNSLAAQDGVISVGSVDNDGKLSVWSNSGKNLDLLMPWDVSVTDKDEVGAGTSFSTAYAAGIAALMLSENPGMSSDEVLSALRTLTGDISKEAAEIKGVKVDELLSKQKVILQNQSEFTGYTVKDPAINGNSIQK